MLNAFLAAVVLLFASVSAYPYAVATSSPYASEAALEMMKKGGNATDAIVAASFAQNVTQPYLMGMGGGGFYLISYKGKVTFLDHREAGPASANPKMFLTDSGSEIPFWPDRVTGPNPVGVPGTVAGLYEAHKRFGKLPWKTLLAPAIKLAREGFPITEKFQAELADHWNDRLKALPGAAALFGDGSGDYLKRGQLLRQPDLAKTLEKLAASPMSFYTGALAKSWTDAAHTLGVKITLDDLKNYNVRDSKPIRFNVFGLEGVTAAPPSAAGLMVAGSLRFLDQYYKAHGVASPDSAKRVIATAETLAYFQKLRNDNLADMPASKIDPQKFLGSAEEKAAWKEIETRINARLEKIGDKVSSAAPIKPLMTAQVERGHTSHLSAVDDHGMVVAYTTTIEEVFGSGLVVPGHGFMLNNELSDFSASPDHPNAAAPGKRPRSNMSPTILFERKGGAQIPVSVTGCAGGPLIPTAVVELLENYYVHKMSARQAIAFPRFHPNGEKLEIENTMSPAVIEQLKKAGYEIEASPTLWAIAQSVMRRNTSAKWEAAAEPRYDSLGISLE